MAAFGEPSRLPTQASIAGLARPKRLKVFCFFFTKKKFFL
jgi:hypothetical protein